MVRSSQRVKKKKKTHNYYSLEAGLDYDSNVLYSFVSCARNVNLFLTSYHLNVSHRIMALLFLICNKGCTWAAHLS